MGDPLERLSSCDLSDACDVLNLAAVRTGGLRPLWPECPPVAGRLVTVRLEPAPGAPSPLADLLDVLADARDRVVLVDLAGRVDVQCWGSVLATAARRHGVRGALVHGAARDVDGLRALGFPTYARGVHPAGMRGRLRVAALAEPVELDGQTIEPDSLACADESGVVIFAGVRADEVTALATERRSRELRQLRSVEQGADPRSVLSARRDP